MAMWNVLQAVHKRVLNGFTYKTDKAQFGVIERWTLPANVDNLTADCEEFAIACRMLLKEKLIMSRLVYCRDEENAGHLVAEVNGYILDNRQTRVVTRETLERKGYCFISISGFESGEDWRKL